MRVKYVEWHAHPGVGVVSHGLTVQEEWYPQRKVDVLLIEDWEVDALQTKTTEIHYSLKFLRSLEKIHKSLH